jgi:hypothetical protein
MFTLQHTDLLAQGEHLQPDVQAVAKENHEVRTADLKRRSVLTTDNPERGRGGPRSMALETTAVPKELHARVIWNMHTYYGDYGCSATLALPAGPL